MKEFKIYSKSRKKVNLVLDNVHPDSITGVRFDAECKGYSVTDTCLSYGGGCKKPFIRLMKDDGTYINAPITKEIIEYLWENSTQDYCSILYGFTQEYKANWCD